MTRGKKRKGCDLAYRRKHYKKSKSEVFEGCPEPYNTSDSELKQSCYSHSKLAEDCKTASASVVRKRKRESEKEDPGKFILVTPAESDTFEPEGGAGTYKPLSSEPVPSDESDPGHLKHSRTCDGNEQRLSSETDGDHTYARCSDQSTDVKSPCSEDLETDREYVHMSLGQSNMVVSVYTFPKELQPRCTEPKKYVRYAIESSYVDKSCSEHIQLDSSNTSKDRSADIEVGFTEEAVEAVSFQSLASDVLKCVPNDYVCRISETDILLLKLYDHEDLSIKLSVRIDSQFTCCVSVHRQSLDQTHAIFRGLPTVFDSVTKVLILLDRLNSVSVCCGNPQERYHYLVPIGGELTDETEIIDVTVINGFREGDFGAISATGVAYSSTIRSSKCLLLTENKKSSKCIQCSNFARSLRKRHIRVQERIRSNKTFSHTSFKHKDMTRDELYIKLKEQKIEIDNLKNQVRKLEMKCEKTLGTERVSLQVDK